MLDFFVIGIVASCAVAFTNWRWGLRLAIVVGALQDPVRKLTPNASPLMAIASLPVWIAIMAGVFRHDPRALQRVRVAYPRVSRWAGIFLITLVPPVMVVFLYGFGVWQIAFFGVFAYVAPLGLTVVGFSLIREEQDMLRFMRFYALFVTCMLTGTVLEYLQVFPDWPALGTRALGFVWLRTVANQAPIALIAGFYRSPDLMGWHAATLMMISVTLALRRSASSRLWLVLVILGGLCVLMAGRRKAMMMPAVWMFVVLFAYLRSRRMAATVTVLGVVGLALFGFFFATGGMVTENYYSYAASTTRDGPARLFEGAVGSVWMTFLQSGFLGKGIGTVAQGMGHIAGDLEQGWQESGPSRVLAELGVPGFVVALLMGAMLARACYRVLRRASPQTPSFPLQVGLVALVAANAASFIVSHQIYTDLSVMPLAAVFLGAALSGPRWCVAPEPVPRRQIRAWSLGALASAPRKSA
jgi:hypothetical protein